MFQNTSRTVIMMGPAYLLLIALVSPCFSVVENQDYWNKKSFDELQDSLNIKWNINIAKNVIIFIGDGMGPNTVVASRTYRNGEASNLIFEKFPHVGLLKTYTVNKQVPDSASTATALLTGVKNNFETTGVDYTVTLNDCLASLEPKARLESIASWALSAQKSTGFVTNTRVTHATPSAMYAHTANRKWECDAAYPTLPSQCKDIARQLVEDYPGNKLNVIMGGGKFMMDGDPNPNAKRDAWNCKRKDGRKLTEKWTQDKKSEGVKHAFVSNNEELRGLNLDNVDYLMGIFANNHMITDHLRDDGPKGSPSLHEMTTSAIKVLKNNHNGFVLMVEGGLIDMAHHNGTARVALQETLALNNAVNATLDLLNQLNILQETLVIVTSDHTHSLSINGYPERGNNILGLGLRSRLDSVPFTTLSYTVTGKSNYHYTSVDGQVKREDPSTVDTTSYSYHQQGSILNDENIHGGGDVNIYAKGPMAHLFHSVHEQNYVARVIAYAAQIGPHAKSSSSSSSVLLSLTNLLCIVYVARIFIAYRLMY